MHYISDQLGLLAKLLTLAIIAFGCGYTCLSIKRPPMHRLRIIIAIIIGFAAACLTGLIIHSLIVQVRQLPVRQHFLLFAFQFYGLPIIALLVASGILASVSYIRQTYFFLIACTNLLYLFISTALNDIAIHLSVHVLFKAPFQIFSPLIIVLITCLLMFECFIYIQQLTNRHHFIFPNVR